MCGACPRRNPTNDDPNDLQERLKQQKFEIKQLESRRCNVAKVSNVRIQTRSKPSKRRGHVCSKPGVGMRWRLKHEKITRYIIYIWLCNHQDVSCQSTVSVVQHHDRRPHDHHFHRHRHRSIYHSRRHCSSAVFVLQILLWLGFGPHFA